MRYTVHVNGEEVQAQQGLSAPEIARLVGRGIPQQEAVELLLAQRGGSLRVRPVINARWYGIARHEIEEILEADPLAADAYIRLRRAGSSHAEAAEVKNQHFCAPAEVKTYGKMNPVLNTGEVTRITFCRCGGEIYRSQEKRNWSGD